MAKGVATPNIQSKHWVFTINNYTEVDMSIDLTQWAYLVYGKEVGASGTPHLQGYGCLVAKKRLSTVSKLLPRARLDKMKGTPLQASDYCKKDDKEFFEHGVLPKTHQEATKDAYAAYYELAKQDRIDEIPTKIRVRFYHVWRRIGQDYQVKPADSEDCTGEWHWGEPGVGKSHSVRADNPEFYDKPLNKWWDGFLAGQPSILDDVSLTDADWLPTKLKRWADKYSFPGEMKGTTRQIRPAKLIVTSNYSLAQFLEKCDPVLRRAVQRRFKVYHHVSREEVVLEDESRLEYSPDGISLLMGRSKSGF